jgi:hypothetical protein
MQKGIGPIRDDLQLRSYAEPMAVSGVSKSTQTWVQSSIPNGVTACAVFSGFHLNCAWTVMLKA